MLINRIIDRIKYEWSKLFVPTMIGRFKRFDGIRLKKTRVSNTTYIGCRENLKIEDNVFIGHFNFIDACNGITIKEGCQITNYISILTHSSHISIRLYGKHYGGTEMKGYVKGSVYIGEYTFIGPHSTIMPGSKIGKGSIVSAYSYVTGDFPDFSIIAGNPAKVVGDTRKMDDTYMENFSELKPFYNEWVNKN